MSWSHLTSWERGMVCHSAAVCTAVSATFQHLVAPFHCWYGAQGGAPTTSTVWEAFIPFVCTLRRLTPSTEKVVVHKQRVHGA